LHRDCRLGRGEPGGKPMNRSVLRTLNKALFFGQK
jgi:hypothetical protein